jgi:hypothetical protein
VAAHDPKQRKNIMRKRVKMISGAAAALVALALGGSAIASATQGSAGSPRTSGVSSAVTPEKTSVPDTDNLKAADQLSPDSKSAAAESTTGPDADKLKAGDQTTPDTNGKASGASASEQPDSSSSESSTESDGPGGHEDPEGNVDYQSESQQ